MELKTWLEGEGHSQRNRRTLCCLRRLKTHVHQAHGVFCKNHENGKEHAIAIKMVFCRGAGWECGTQGKRE